MATLKDVEAHAAHPAPGAPGTQLPEWELPPVDGKPKSRLNGLVFKVPEVHVTPHHSTAAIDFRERVAHATATIKRRTCPGAKSLSRKWKIIIAAGCAALLVLVLGVGLGVGLKKSYAGPNNVKSGSGINMDSSNGADQALPLPSNTDSHTGDLTYYDVGLGACGLDSKENEKVVAIAESVFDHAQSGSNPNLNPLCGRRIRATRFYQQIGKQRSVDLKVVDRCTECKPTDLDVSRSVFKYMAFEGDGRVNVTWVWLST